MPARIILTIGYIIVNNTWGAYQPYNINYMYHPLLIVIIKSGFFIELYFTKLQFTKLRFSNIIY